MLPLQCPKTCQPNEDGSKYSDHVLSTADWDIIREFTGTLWPVYKVVNILQGEDYPTLPLLYPCMGKLLKELHSGSPVVLQDDIGDPDLYVIKPKQISKQVRDARLDLYQDLKARFYSSSEAAKVKESDMLCAGVASLLDPRCPPLGPSLLKFTVQYTYDIDFCV